MGDARLRRWLVPGAAVAAFALPLLAGGCFDLGDEEWSLLEDCGGCAGCWEPSPGATRLLPPGAEPPPPEEPSGAEGELRYGLPDREELEGALGGEIPEAGEGQAEGESAGEPPTAPFRPRVPDGVLRPPTQSPKPSY